MPQFADRGGFKTFTFLATANAEKRPSRSLGTTPGIVADTVAGTRLDGLVQLRGGWPQPIENVEPSKCV